MPIHPWACHIALRPHVRPAEGKRRVKLQLSGQNAGDQVVICLEFRDCPAER